MADPDSSTVDVQAEFDRQVANLVRLDYPALAGVTPGAFAELVEPLRAVVRRVAGSGLATPAAGRAPFLLVVPRALAPIEAAMPLTTLAGGARPGIVDRLFEPGALARFTPIPGVDAPAGQAYLVFDVERGEEYCGAAPEKALAAIAERGRTPLTIEEGIALVTQRPDTLARNMCFSLGGSRSGDRRVPALWISQHAPKLGWCWAGNPHRWLGMASAGARAAA